MFFIGGLNTVLPYILYLSLIWAFMLIGYTGRPQRQWSSNSHAASTSIVSAYNLSQSQSQVQDNEISNSEVIPASFREHSIQPTYLQFVFNPLNQQYGYSNSHPFRGPPDC